jgi:hypothetical protein
MGARQGDRFVARGVSRGSGFAYLQQPPKGRHKRQKAMRFLSTRVGLKNQCGASLTHS